MAWYLYPQHRDTLPIVQGAGWVQQPVWTWAEDLAHTCIGNLKMKNNVISKSPNCQVGYFIWPAAFLILSGLKCMNEVL
jgi:hypothetical protein